MHSLFVIVVCAVLFSSVFAAPYLPDFVPCSFSVRFKTYVYGPEGDVVANSTDRFMRDNQNDLWRWDSDFSGFIPFLDPQQTIIIWRPDLSTSYHDYGDRCIKNDGMPTMFPLPFDYLYQKTSGMDWFQFTDTWEGLPSYVYRSTFLVPKFNITVVADIITLQSNGALVIIKGTAKSVEYGLDLTYAMEVEYFEQHQEILPLYFIPSPHCNNGNPIPSPPPSTQTFDKECYGLAGSSGSNAGFRSGASYSMVLALLLVALLLF